jgi:hypothetical protein
MLAEVYGWVIPFSFVQTELIGPEALFLVETLLLIGVEAPFLLESLIRIIPLSDEHPAKPKL